MTRNLLILLVLSFEVAGPAAAGARSRRAHPENGPAVIAHLASEAVLAPRMSLRYEDGWDRLYVQDQTGAWTVLDVSRPSKPAVFRKVQDGGLKQIGGSLALVEENAPKPVPPPVKVSHLRIMDTSDPAHPHAITELDGASSYAVDVYRGLLFVSNAAGLWVVHDSGLVDASVKAWEQFASAQ